MPAGPTPSTLMTAPSRRDLANAIRFLAMGDDNDGIGYCSRS